MEGDIPYKPITSFARRIFHPIDANIDNDSAIAHVLRLHEVRLTNRRDNNIRRPSDLFQIAAL